MKRGVVGVDFGLTTTDALAWRTAPDNPGVPADAHVTLLRPGVATPALLQHLLDELGVADTPPAWIAVTGGRSRDLPDMHAGTRVIKVSEPEAIGRGGLALAGVTRALVVSCGTGTAITLADASHASFAHVSGTAVGGGTLVGLGHALLHERDAEALAKIALTGDASGVDTTLGEVLGGGVGSLPPEATAVNLGRLADLQHPPSAADLAAGLTTMIGQVIALLAINAAQAHNVEQVVMIGRLAQLAPLQQTFDHVADLYRRPRFLVPEAGGSATALGAMLAANART